MSIRRIVILLIKELKHGSRNLMFIFAVVMPVVITLIISLLFGTIFSGKARLGLVDEGSSQLVEMAAALESITTRTYLDHEALRQAVDTGAVDVGLVIPAGYDQLVSQGQPVHITIYVWGESTLKDRAIPLTALVTMTRQIAGQVAPVEIETTILGEGENIPWEQRLLPFIVLMTIVIGGSMVPATSLVEEKQKRTLRALTTTSVSLGEVLAAKGLLGVLLSMTMAIVTLILNRAFGGSTGLLVLVLFLGSVMAANIGILLGAFVKDVNTLFTVVKAGGILLYAPALVYLFPEIPQWVGQIFPTYYMIQPVVEITQRGGTFADVAVELVVLVVLIFALMGIISVLIRRASLVESSLNPA